MTRMRKVGYAHNLLPIKDYQILYVGGDPQFIDMLPATTDSRTDQQTPYNYRLLIINIGVVVCLVGPSE